MFFVASGFATVVNLPVMNPSFEDLPAGGLPSDCGAGCHFDFGAIPDWTSSPGTIGGQFQPGTQAPFDNTTFFNSVPDGITSAFLTPGTISQTVGTVQEGEIYTLMVDLGHRNDMSFTALADLMVGGTKIMAIGIDPGLGDWSTFTARFVGTEANEDEPITIQLNGSGPQGNFDNVRLTSEPVPEPSSMLPLARGVLGLAQVLRRKLL